MNEAYKIQIIPHNLSKEETVVQMVEILDHLNDITQDILSKVSKRLDENAHKLSGITERIQTAATKVEKLKGDKKAKTVFSSSKYPAMDVCRDYVSIFNEPTKVERKMYKVKHSKYVSTYEPLSKLQFYHVRVTDSKPKTTPHGLGDIPSDTKCINDLLLFNTGKNIYKDFKPEDSLKGRLTTSNKENTTSELGAAPVSISQRSSVQQTVKYNYFYTPKNEELPALDVPWDLPDLPGIANDVRYENDMLVTSIAPSAINDSLETLEGLKLPSIEETKHETDHPVPPDPPQDIVEPPPPPPVHLLTQQAEITEPKKTEDLPDNMTPIVEKQEEPTPIKVAVTVDPRASLMDAIRKAGGSKNAKLKKINEEPAIAGSKTAAPSGDLMADLHNKLMMRRKGISGVKSEDNQVGMSTANSAFARLSSIIPPPVKSNEEESAVSEDDNDDWNED
ncbi:WASH complex subunit 1 [Anthonomus grandis grandis]|uniref:WASH complex subunit 1 n=1 Tax=Anthonomus grandis grandis TaxID=2921223 RepID=UPI0021666EA6|nr:WASH complex subunit 1 [Anthonomus grandis grandis]